MKKLMKYIKVFLFGERAKGYSLPTPTFKTTEINNRPSMDQWVKEFKFGTRYGHRGSFYQSKL